MNSRCTPMLAAALLACAAAAPLRAQDNDGPPAPPAAHTLERPLPPPAAATALLRYKFTAGQVIRYRSVADIAMKITDTVHHQTIPINQHIETVTKQTVQSVNSAKDTATLLVQVESIEGTINGQPMPQTDARQVEKSGTGTVVITSTGKVVSVKMSAAGKVPGFDPTKLSLYQQNGLLPTRAIKPGDTWVSTIGLNSFGAKIISNFQLTELTPSDAGVIAQIKQNASGVINSAAATALPAGLKIGGKVDMTGDLQFDVNAGSIKSQTSTAHFDATVNSPAQTAAKPTAKKPVKKAAPAAAPNAAKIHFDLTGTTTRLENVSLTGSK